MNLFKRQTFLACMILILCITQTTFTLEVEALPEIHLDPFTLIDSDYSDDYIKVKLAPQTFGTVSEEIKTLSIEIPLPDKGKIATTLEPFSIISNDAQFYFGSTDAPKPTIQLFRGHIDDDPSSIVYLTISNENKANGIIIEGSGSRYILSESPDYKLDGLMTVHKESASATLPDFPTFCGVEENAGFTKSLETQLSQSAILDGKTRIARLAIDADLKYIEIFDNSTDAQNYAVQLIGAISSIYIRDFDIKLEIAYLKLWTSGSEPFDSGDLGSYANYWNDSLNPYIYNIVHLLSGRRDLSFGGIAYLSGTCLNDYSFSISGYLNGSFPSPLDAPHLGNWDVIVSAHEMGHNFGTGHTHDYPEYDPIIDSCGFGVPTQGTIMSYCHIFPGSITNTDLRFHGRVIERVKQIIASSNCWEFDCNDNGISDATDISSGLSTDVNFNNIPDECEDCNENGIIDFEDILNGAADMNHDGIPDECEIDCDNNSIPDDIEIQMVPSLDMNFNGILDACEPDCDGNGIIDYFDIENDTYTDYDRNQEPDICQDCNNNGIVDWDDTEKQFNLFVADITGNYVREYHTNSGVPIGNHATSGSASYYDVVFDDAGNLYIADSANSKIVKTDILNNSSSDFIITDGNLTSPTALVIAPNGNLLIANSSNSTVLEYNISTGSYVGEFVTTGSPLANPMAMTIGWGGNLYVSSANSNSILKYNGTTGAYLGEFVSSGVGGLISPRGLLFDGDRNLLVCSYSNNRILRYDGTTGSFIDIFSDEVEMENPWDIAVGPSGNIFVSRSGGTPRIIKYAPAGRYILSYVRGDYGMLQPTGIAFKSASTNDCNGNFIPDDCDISSGFSQDANSNSVPDACEEAIVDNDNDGVNSDQDCDDNNPDVQFVDTYYYDGDLDGFGDENTVVTICTPPTGYILVGGDCDDSNPNINPNGTEICNGKDDDCNGIEDDGLVGPDSDSDGFPDDCDICPNDPENDIDNDGICGDIDNCPTIANPLQEDLTFDGIGDACCCIGTTGNVDNDPNDEIDISDLVWIVDFIFLSGLPSSCPNEANVDGNGEIDISDLVLIVDFIFIDNSIILPNCPN